jgi:ABC-type sugar transport system substrate-binding protein
VLLGSRSPERGQSAVEQLVNAHPDARGRYGGGKDEALSARGAACVRALPAYGDVCIDVVCAVRVHLQKVEMLQIESVCVCVCVCMVYT